MITVTLILIGAAVVAALFDKPSIGIFALAIALALHVGLPK